MLRTLPAFSMAPAMDHRSSIDHRAPSPLPPLGHDISRPSSTSTQASNIMRHFQGQNNINLPGLSALASVASGSPHMRAYTALNGHNLHYSTASPTPTSVGGQGNHPPVCQNCTTSTTPLWRRDELGSVLCNACGLFLKLHGRPRPISLKTDVIKSRNRVKSSSQKKKTLYDANGAPLSRSENGSPSQSLDRRVSQKTSDSDRSNSPLSRATTPAMPVMPQPNRLQLPSILDHHPQHEHSFNHSPPSLPPLNLRQPSPGSFAHAAERQDRPVELLPTYEQLQQANNAHRTRISELEVINDLYRSRVTELESNEQRLRTVEAQLRAALDEAQRGEAHYKKRSYDLEKEISVATQDERPAKRSRLSDVLSPEDAK